LLITNCERSTMYTCANKNKYHSIRTVQISNQNCTNIQSEQYKYLIRTICTVLIGYLYCSDWIFVLFWLDICTVLIRYLYCSDWIFVQFWLDICTVLMLWYLFLLAHVYIVLLSQWTVQISNQNSTNIQSEQYKYLNHRNRGKIDTPNTNMQNRSL
jgi:hypothetical protein